MLSRAELEAKVSRISDVDYDMFRIHKELKPVIDHRLNILRDRYAGAMESPEFLTPKFQTEFWQDFFADDPTIAVPECVLPAVFMQTPMIGMRGENISPMFVYHPDIFVGQEGLKNLARRIPSLQYGRNPWNNGVGDVRSIKDIHSDTGYIKVEATLEAPNTGCTEEEVLNHLKNLSIFYKGQRVSTYILLSQALYILTGRRPDDRGFTLVRLPGSERLDQMIYTKFKEAGGIEFYVVNPAKSDLFSVFCGARFEETPFQINGGGIAYLDCTLRLD